MIQMGNRNLGLYFIIFAVLYFLFTTFVAGHGVHAVNLIITIGVLILGVYFIFKK